MIDLDEERFQKSLVISANDVADYAGSCLWLALAHVCFLMAD
jgi:hypothetical protein